MANCQKRSSVDFPLWHNSALKALDFRALQIFRSRVFNLSSLLLAVSSHTATTITQLSMNNGYMPKSGQWCLRRNVSRNWQALVLEPSATVSPVMWLYWWEIQWESLWTMRKSRGLRVKWCLSLLDLEELIPLTAEMVIRFFHSVLLQHTDKCLFNEQISYLSSNKLHLFTIFEWSLPSMNLYNDSLLPWTGAS